MVPVNAAFATFPLELFVKQAFSVPAASSVNTPIMSPCDHNSPVTLSLYSSGSMQVRVNASPPSITAVITVSPPVIESSFSAMSAQPATNAAVPIIRAMYEYILVGIFKLFIINVFLISSGGRRPQSRDLFQHIPPRRPYSALTVFVHWNVVTTGKWSE